jgi:hypothetical protein
MYMTFVSWKRATWKPLSHVICLRGFSPMYPDFTQVLDLMRTSSGELNFNDNPTFAVVVLEIAPRVCADGGIAKIPLLTMLSGEQIMLTSEQVTAVANTFAFIYGQP